jgi:hypothetical protein
VPHIHFGLTDSGSSWFLEVPLSLFPKYQIVHQATTTADRGQIDIEPTSRFNSINRNLLPRSIDPDEPYFTLKTILQYPINLAVTQ